jgi:quinol monooxygenase YgiN
MNIPSFRRSAPRHDHEHSGVRIRATWHGTVLADSDRTIIIEGNHYFPPEDVSTEYLTESGKHTTCPWKGVETGAPVSLSITRTKGIIMAVRFGLLVTLEAREGQSQALAAFLQQGRAIAAEESGTVTWYAFQVDETTFGVFDTFETVEGRQEHLSGRIPAALGQAADLLAREPEIRPVDIVAAL